MQGMWDTSGLFFFHLPAIEFEEVCLRLVCDESPAPLVCRRWVLRGRLIGLECRVLGPVAWTCSCASLAQAAVEMSAPPRAAPPQGRSLVFHALLAPGLLHGCTRQDPVTITTYFFFFLSHFQHILKAGA